MRRVSKRLSATGTLDVVATAIPGIKDILVLGKVKQLETLSASGADGAPEFIVVDAPAAGHAVSFLASRLRAPRRRHGGPDPHPGGRRHRPPAPTPTRCQVMLVTMPEETPVNEAADTAFHLEDRTGVKLAPIVVNGLWPHLDLPADTAEAVAAIGAALAGADLEALDRAAEFRRQRQHLQDAQVARLADMLPLPR